MNPVQPNDSGALSPDAPPGKAAMPPVMPPSPAPTAPATWEGSALRRSYAPLIVSLLLAALAAGAADYAWQLWNQQQRTAAALRTTRTQVKTLQRERSQTRKTVNELEQVSAERQARIAQSDTETLELKTKLGAAEARLDELQDEREELNERVAEFRKVTQQFQRMIDSGKLQVNFRRGRMIVDLPAAVLFASGSAELSDDGRGALKEVAKILRHVPGKRFIVGGHTDNVPIAKAQTGYSSNWALSAARAVTVTDALVEAGLRPTHLVAAGFGEYDPVASNQSSAGRQKNRRIEIVLEPELRDLPNALKPTHDKSAKSAKSDRPKPAKH